MRMVKMKPESLTLEQAIHKFLLVKESQHTSEETIKDYQNCLARFLRHSRNSLDEAQLEDDVLTFFAAIPNTSPARYNKPFQNINAFLNWLVEQAHIQRNPIKVHKLRKRRDDGNIKPAAVDALQTFLSSLDQSTYTGLRDYVICMVMLDTGIRTKELLALRNGDYHRNSKSIVVDKLTAKTRIQRTAYLSSTVAGLIDMFISRKPAEWDDWLFPNYEGHQLKVTHLDKAFCPSQPRVRNQADTLSASTQLCDPVLKERRRLVQLTAFDGTLRFTHDKALYRVGHGLYFTAARHVLSR